MLQAATTTVLSGFAFAGEALGHAASSTVDAVRLGLARLLLDAGFAAADGITVRVDAGPFVPAR